LAASCYALHFKKHSFLPVKWAKTSVATILQQLHNPKVEIQTLREAQMMHCEQRANYILDGHLAMAQSMFPRVNGPVERRAKPRSNDALPARVWGVDIEDQPFSFDCFVDNISASGIYLRLPRRMKFSSAISLVVRLLNGPVDGVAAAIKGIVIRDETQSDGHRGVGIRIVEHKFI
jgi:hypothetical protein